MNKVLFDEFGQFSSEGPVDKYVLSQRFYVISLFIGNTKVKGKKNCIYRKVKILVHLTS